MSKMSQIHLDLCEQANRLGFESLEEAEANGYHIAYDSTGWKLKLDMAKAYEQARKDWEKERDNYLNTMDVIKDVLIDINTGLMKSGDIELIKAWQLDVLASEQEKAIEFFKKGEV